ncbi:lycopene cyclase domain-containing protein [Cellulomonas marina]|uniref:Lycopene cyclase domain-containing protein n=1 Tax=Cellulomonas marina TaxID=988821 RepID=A0A1I1AVZ5_9CELL|nr:lycopene cyclase domain-containing protein [Cellulomonas marina]GIG30699.1 hypothetical protein Cma02nite_32990 [Cellulomonas marina]SFB42047.1 lycopene cyclase domain-containing protein [Cellulomonas marina]
MGVLYLTALVLSLVGQALVDHGYRTFFWRDARRAAVVMAVGLAFFLTWDVAGIATGIFFRGSTDLMTGVLLAPELPLEELFFLTLLCWSTMNVWGLMTRPGAQPEVPR